MKHTPITRQQRVRATFKPHDADRCLIFIRSQSVDAAKEIAREERVVVSDTLVSLFSLGYAAITARQVADSAKISLLDVRVYLAEFVQSGHLTVRRVNDRSISIELRAAAGNSNRTVMRRLAAEAEQSLLSYGLDLYTPGPVQLARSDA